MEIEFNPCEAIEIYYYGFNDENESAIPLDAGLVDVVPATFRS